MTYENAPATILLATHCAACGRALVDAVSVEIGMGPDCREKYGYEGLVDSEQRAEANKLVHFIAATRDDVGPTTHEAIARVKALGFETLATKLAERIASLEKKAKVVITLEGDRYVVKSTYREAAVKALRDISGRRWDASRQVNTFPITSKVALFQALVLAYSGELAIGPKGVFHL